MALLLLGASCTRRDHHVREVANLRPAADDPAIRGRGLNPSLIRPSGSPSPDDKDELSSRVQWSPVAEFDLKAGESRSFLIVLPQPATVLVRILWSGAPGPISVAVTQGGLTVATGAIFSDPPDRGDVIAHGTAEAGEIHLSIYNNGKQPARLQAIWGTLVEEQP